MFLLLLPTRGKMMGLSGAPSPSAHDVAADRAFQVQRPIVVQFPLATLWTEIAHFERASRSFALCVSL
jgi:hypothetical protein